MNFDKRRNTAHRSEQVFALAACCLLPCALGCRTLGTRADLWLTGGWVTEYETAERMARTQNRPVLIHYVDARDKEPDPLQFALEADTVRPVLDRCICCKLYNTSEPDRRYVAQFGVDHAPAVILLHRDGTYHARQGRLSAEELRSFLAEAKPPGRKPNTDPLIVRRPRYAWLGSLAEIESAIDKQDRPALIVLYRPVSRDWFRLRRLLSAQEVWRQVHDMVHGRIAVYPLWGDTYDHERFGKVRLPALIVLHPDGAYRVLEQPLSAEAVALFALESRTSEGKRADREASSSPASAAARPPSP